MTSKFTKPRLLILGGSSLLSFLWCDAVNEYFSIYLTKHIKDVNYLKYPSLPIKIDSLKSLTSSLKVHSIDYVVNTIGLTSVEECESNHEKAYFLNSHLPGIIAKACLFSNTKLIHISTDHYFHNENKKHKETDKVTLINVYSKSKYNGELEVLSNNSSALICRTNFFGYGPPHKLSFSDWILKAAKNQKQITLFNDVTITPLSGKNLAIYSHKLLDLNAQGIYNICSDDSITKYDFGIKLCKHFGLKYKNIKSGSIVDRKDLIKRPKSMALSNLKTIKKINEKIGNIENQIKSI
tara:strand:- start:2752 stop:3636 length:885 start_codon:yes stop_codon:yes gene_type:complete